MLLLPKRGAPFSEGHAAIPDSRLCLSDVDSPKAGWGLMRSAVRAS
jgi:hypothetical protein